jgi:hypothetical protein
MSTTRSTVRGALLLAMAVCLAGCSKDAEVNAVITDLDAFTEELVKKVEGAADPAAGVDAAQKFLEERGGSIRTRFAEIKHVRGFQISEETKKKLTECGARNMMAVGTLRIKHVARAMQDPDFDKRLKKLTDDYQGLLTTI